MWISKNELERLKQFEQSFFKCMRRNSDEDCRYKEMQKNLVSLSDYYAERLEWWRGKFDKKPKNHKLRIDWNNDCEIIEKNNLEAIEQTLDRFKKESDFIEIDDFETNRKIIVPVNQIKNYTVIPGHPDPYTDSEIESWAKEQLEQEMKGWRVVKEEPERLYKWRALLTNISGD